MTNEHITEALKTASREQLEAELKSRPRSAFGPKKKRIRCPKGCGSVLGATEIRYHRCDGPPKPEDKSPHWDMVSSDAGIPEWPYNEGFPCHPFAKCEIIMRDGKRYTAWIDNGETSSRWNTHRLGVNVIDSRDVAAWKVIEDFA